MKKLHLFGMLAVAAIATSCSNDGVVNQAPQDNAIQFGTYLGNAAQSRGAETTTATLYGADKGFGILASYTGQDSYSNQAMNFMYNQQVTTADNGTTWTYSPIKYWPTTEDDKLSFFAYAPYNATGLTLSKNTVAGTPTVTLAVQNVESMVDFVAATRYNVSHDDSKQGTPADNKVNFTLKHELTRVNLKAVVDERATVTSSDTRVVITSIKLDNSGVFYGLGKYTFGATDEARGTWSDLTVATQAWDLANILVTDKTNDLGVTPTEITATNPIWLKLTDEATSLFKTTDGVQDYLFLLPPNGTDGLTDAQAITATVEYYIVTKDVALQAGYTCTKAVKTVNLNAEKLLAQGKAYSYTLKIGLDEIQVSATVDAWGDETSNDATVEYVNVDVPQTSADAGA